MIRARAALVLDHPFFGSIALRLTLKPDQSNSLETSFDARRFIAPGILAERFLMLARNAKAS